MIMDYVLLVIILVVASLVGYTLYKVNQNFDIVTGEMKTFRTSVGSEMSDLKGVLKQDVDSKITNLSSNVASEVRIVTGELAENKVTTQKTIQSLSLHDSRVDEQIASLTKLGKIAEVGQARINTTYTKSGVGQRVDTTYINFTNKYSK